MKVNLERLLRTCLIGFLLCCVSQGCRRTDVAVSRQERERVVSALDELYCCYLSGTTMEARSNMLKAIARIHENRARIPELEAGLPIAYARMSLLERKAGNEALSRTFFEKMRYWRIVEWEKIGLRPEEIIAKHDAFTRDDSDKEVISWDKKYTKGVGAAYFANPDKGGVKN